jgi:ABC-type transporter MlaC component
VRKPLHDLDMKKTLTLVTMALVLGVLAPSAALADADPVAAVKADVAKLLSDASARHDVVIADANKLAADAEAAKGGTKAAARATIKADLAKLRADRKAAAVILKADRAQLKTDLEAAKEAKALKGLRGTLKDARDTLKQQRAEVKQALEAAHAAVKELRASFKK